MLFHYWNQRENHFTNRQVFLLAGVHLGLSGIRKEWTNQTHLQTELFEFFLEVFIINEYSWRCTYSHIFHQFFVWVDPSRSLETEENNITNMYTLDLSSQTIKNFHLKLRIIGIPHDQNDISFYFKRIITPFWMFFLNVSLKFFLPKTDYLLKSEQYGG